MLALKRGRTGDGRVLAVAFRGREPPQGALATQGRTRDVQLQRLFGTCGIQNRHGKSTTVFGPRGNDIEWKRLAAGIDSGLLATGWIQWLGLRRVAGNIHGNGPKVVTIDFKNQTVGGECNVRSVAGEQ
jgi:hypothetical protein